ncbi:MAG: TonB-dependent receptor [Bacteroidales bacterium]|nr:TonB-dependent receptor [Bacteroidales bacterium]
MFYIFAAVLSKEEVRRSFVCLAGLLLATAALSAQESLEEVTVSGTRVPLTMHQSARMVTVLDTMLIRSSPAQTVNDLLKYAVGVDVRQRGAMGIQTDIGIRGGTFDQIAVLLNGINISDPQTGHLVMDLPVDLSEIDRIEILEGPAGRVYGTSSLVGAINIVTRTEKRSGADIRLEGGSWGTLGGGVVGNLASGRWNNQLSASCGRSDGYSLNAAGTRNADWRTVKAFYQGSYAGKQADVRWHLGLSGKDYGANTFYSARFDDQFEHGLKTFAAVQAETRGRVHFRPAIYWNHSGDRFELYRGDESRVPFNYHSTDVFGANLGGWFSSPFGRTAFGAEIRREGIVSTTLGEPLETPRAIRGTQRDYTRGLKRTNLSFYLEHNIILQRFTASAGIAVIRNTWGNLPFRFYPGADLSVRIGDNWKTYASWNTSLRMPTFTELYYSVGGHAADKYLRPERMQAFELGLKYLRPGISAIASVYYHRGSDMIDWIKDLSQGEDALWVSVNHTQINTLGEELSLRLTPGTLFGRPDFFVRSFNASYAHIRQDKALEPHLQSAYALEYLRNKLVLQTDLRIYGPLSVNLSYRWQDRVGNYEAFEAGKSLGQRAYTPYSLIDARLTWEARHWRAFVEGNNLLGITYYDHGNIPQPGFWFRAGMQFRLR